MAGSNARIDVAMANAVLVPITNFTPQAPVIQSKRVRLKTIGADLDKHHERVRQNIMQIPYPDLDPTTDRARAYEMLATPWRAGDPDPDVRNTAAKCLPEIAAVRHNLARLEAYNQYAAASKEAYIRELEQAVEIPSLPSTHAVGHGDRPAEIRRPSGFGQSTDQPRVYAEPMAMEGVQSEAPGSGANAMRMTGDWERRNSRGSTNDPSRDPRRRIT